LYKEKDPTKVHGRITNESWEKAKKAEIEKKTKDTSSVLQSSGSAFEASKKNPKSKLTSSSPTGSFSPDSGYGIIKSKLPPPKEPVKKMEAPQKVSQKGDKIVKVGNQTFVESSDGTSIKNMNKPQTKMAQKQSGYDFVFTINNPTEEDLSSIWRPELMNYLIIAFEYGPMSSKHAELEKIPHIQGYVQMKYRQKKYTIGYMSKLLPRAWIEVRSERSCPIFARDYCKKGSGTRMEPADDADFKEYGTFTETYDPETENQIADPVLATNKKKIKKKKSC